MASMIEQALGATQGFQKVNPYNVDLGGLKYQAAQIQREEPSKSDLHQVFDSFLDVAKPVVKSYDTYLQNDAKERFSKAQQEFQKTGNPNVYKEAIDQGTLFHHDNPYTHQFVYSSFGQRTQLEADTQTDNEVKLGQIPASGTEFEQRKRENRNKAIQDAAKNWGIDTNDTDFNKGFTQNLQQSDNVLYSNFEGWKSQTLHKQAVYAVQSNISAIANDPRLTPDQRIQATQAELVKAQHNGVLTDPDLINKTIDYAHQQLSGSKSQGAETGEKFAGAFIQSGFNADGSPNYRQVSSLIGGNQTTRERRLTAESQSVQDDQGFRNSANDTMFKASSNPDKQAGITDVETWRQQAKAQKGIPVNQHDDFIDGLADRTIAGIRQDQQQKNAKLEEQNEKAKVSNAIHDDIAAQMHKSLSTGEAFDIDHLTVSVPGAKSEDVKAQAQIVAKDYWNNWVNAPGLTEEEHNQRALNFINSGRANPNSLQTSIVKNSLQDAQRQLITHDKDHKDLDLWRRLYDQDPTGTAGVLLDKQVSGDAGAAIYDNIQMVKQGGLTTDDIQQVNDYKQNNSKQYSEVDAPKISLTLYGSKDRNTGLVSDTGLLHEMGVPQSMRGTAARIYEANYLRFHSDEKAKMETEKWMKANTITVVNPHWYSSNGETALPVATIRVNGPQDDETSKAYISKRIEDAGITKPSVQTDIEGNVVVYDVDGHNHFTISKSDIRDNINAQAKAEKEKEDAAKAKLETRSNTSNPKGAYK